MIAPKRLLDKILKAGWRFFSQTYFYQFESNESIIAWHGAWSLWTIQPRTASPQRSSMIRFPKKRVKEKNLLNLKPNYIFSFLDDDGGLIFEPLLTYFSTEKHHSPFDHLRIFIPAVNYTQRRQLHFLCWQDSGWFRIWIWRRHWGRGLQIVV